MNEKAIIAERLSKSYEKVQALNEVSFQVEPAELFGVIGPDGAGKTSLFRILTSLILPDGGTARVQGLDPVKDYRQLRRIIGYMPGRFSLYQDLSVEENLNFFATVFGTTIAENYDLIKDIYSQIEPFKNRLAGRLSGGMKQKLALSCALIHRPRVLFLDEPTTGVDAVSRKEFWEMLKKLKQKEITILVSTPYMDEASLCDRVALIQKADMMQIDSPENIIQGFEKQLFALHSKNMYQLISDMRQFQHTQSIFAFGQYAHYTDIRTQADTAQIKNFLQRKGHEKIEIQEIKPNIEDCFMALMQ